MDEFTKSLVNLGISSTLFYMVLFLTSPIAVQLTYQIVCDNVEDDNTMCDTSEVSSITSRTLVFVGLANTIPSFLLSGFYASVADRYGRKLTMHIPTLGYTVYVIMLLYMSFTRSNGGHVSLTGVIVFNAIGLGSLGLSGSFTAYQMSLFTYTADITRKRVENRGTMYSILEASLFLSKTVGPVAAGTFAQEVGFTGPLLLSLAMLVCTFTWNGLMLPESVAGKYPDYDVPLVFDPLRTFRNIGLLFKRLDSAMPWVSIAFFFFFLSYMGNNEIIILFVKHQFGWGPALIGYYEASDALTQAVGMILLPCAVKRYWGRYIDTQWLLIGYVARIAHYLLFAYSADTTMIFAIVPIIALASTITPRSKAIVSNSAPPSEQARVMSGISAVQSAATFCVPAISLGYSYSVYTMPQLMYFVFSGLCTISAGLIVYLVFFVAPAEGYLFGAIDEGGGDDGFGAGDESSMDDTPLLKKDEYERGEEAVVLTMNVNGRSLSRMGPAPEEVGII